MVAVSEAEPHCLVSFRTPGPHSVDALDTRDRRAECRSPEAGFRGDRLRTPPNEYLSARPTLQVSGAAHGFGTSGPVYGFKLHAWTTLKGKIAKDEIHPADLHDFTVGYIMNSDWPAHGGPTQIGDKRYQSGIYLTTPKNSAKQLDPR
ncbi:hypothetical protein GCM10008957_42630 [Deinococcus ruber]|uniref:Uncharacterized protein n=1 Tax=Deinococcus ruber TaxID=1848197 RepID=A0A918FDY2_9DEIO|nr:hypothetical protein GCM10008957_42630 [Deinococcus ruber]